MDLLQNVVGAPRDGEAIDSLSHSLRPIDMHQARLHAIKVSSLQFSWGPLNIERREEPRAGREFFPAGTTEHLIFVRLTDYYVKRESNGQMTEGQYLAGQVSVHPAGIPIRWEWKSKLNFLVMTLAPDFLDRVALGTFGPAAVPVQLWHEDGRHDPLINNVAAALLRELLARDAATQAFIESLATVLSVHLIRHYAQSPHTTPESAPVHRAVAAAVEFIREHYAQEVTLAEMAKAAGISPFHLTRIFKKAIGMSPHQYLIEVRVHSANALLAAGAEHPSLAEVAAAVGFSDQSHLTRQFKRILGTTPKKARR
jgi:AraC family transcriptional regulator